jgi:hypothetical protein
VCLGKINRKIEGRVKGRHLVAKKSVFWPCYRIVLILKDGKEDPNKVGTNEKNRSEVFIIIIISEYRL